MKGFLKWFEFNSDLKTYKFPILKICVCSLVMLLLIAKRCKKMMLSFIFVKYVYFIII